jgi:hypothetical protein
MTLKQTISQLHIWSDWKNNYNYLVPRFIQEASTKENWQDWESDIFQNFFENSNNHCVSSLQQGYFTKDEKQKIKDEWARIGPLLKKIALVQDRMQLDVYNELASVIRQHTTQNRVASTNRLIASLQPQLLCTVVNTGKLDWLRYYLEANLENCQIDRRGSWYERSNAVLNYFTSELEQPPMEIMTLPWQVYEHFKFGENDNSNDMSETETDFQETIALLKYKKQIILQGPPGTGKTRLAKQIAQELITPALDIQKIKAVLTVPQKIPNASGVTDYYTIEAVSEYHVTLSSERATQLWQPSFTQIAKKLIQLEKEEIPENKKSLHPYELAVAKYVFSQGVRITDAVGSVSIVQFHPSYSYEDFVRGISVKPNEDGNGLLYEPENKILGKIADEALANYLDSQKNIDDLSYENWIDEKFSEFVIQMYERFDETGHIPISENVNIVQIENDAFRYKGITGWSNWGNRMKFEDLIRALIDRNTTRQQVKRNTNLSGLANWHATYFYNVIGLFNDFLAEKGYVYARTEVRKVELKNYVLIIDEINRANLSSVLGELIYAFEYRDESIGSIYNSEKLTDLVLPPNLFIIGTMNTADRSVGHIDYAIRRRFAFVDVHSQDLSAELGNRFASKLYKQVSDLFVSNFSNEFDPKDIQLGHSYFIEKSRDGGSMEVRLKHEIKPILFEYVKDGILIGDIDNKTVKQYIEDLKIE